MNTLVIVLIICGVIYGGYKLLKRSQEKVAQELQLINQKYNTNFQNDKHFNSVIFYDLENKKFFFQSVTGIDGVRDFNIIRRWEIEDFPNAKIFKAKIYLYTNDVDTPLIELNYSTYKQAHLDFARLGAIL